MSTAGRERLIYPWIIAICLTFLALSLRGMRTQWVANSLMLSLVSQLENLPAARGMSISGECATAKNISPTALSSLGSVAFEQGDYRMAATCFEQSRHLVETNPFRLRQYVLALSQLDRFDKVISLYEADSARLLWSREVRDAILLAYLQQSNEQTVANTIPVIRELQAQELYARSIVLQEQYGVTKISELPVDAQKELSGFPIEAVMPTDQRLLQFTARVVPELTEDGIWDSERLARVLQFWIWQYPNSLAVEQLLSLFLAVSNDVVSEAHSLMKEELDLRQNEHGTSPVLKSPLFDASHSANMLSNGSFDTVRYDGLPGWQVADYFTGRGVGEPKAAFFAGVDEVVNMSPPNSLRFDGLWDDGTGGFFGVVSLRSRTEGTYMLSIEPQRRYRVSGYYRTRNYSEGVSVYIGNPSVTLLDSSLPATAGAWRRFDFLECHASNRIESMQMLLRLHSTGSVWFDDLSVEPAGINVEPVECH